MENEVLNKARGPMPDQIENGVLVFSGRGFEGADQYRAIAGRAKDRADYYFRYVTEHFDIDNPDLSSSGNLEIFVTWAAFACEVYLKSILYELDAEECDKECPDGRKRFRGHCLSEIYGKLVKSDEEHGSDYSFQISSGIQRFEEQLNAVSTYFEYYRYDFEKDKETLNYAFVFKLMEKLHSITDSIQFLKSIEIYQCSDKSIRIS